MTHVTPLGAGTLLILASLVCHPVNAQDNPSTTSDSTDEPLSFGFLENPPGKLISIGATRLHIDCRGEGEVTILFEAGLGGSALEWTTVREQVDALGRTCTYDRAGYGWSDPIARRRDARRLSIELDLLLDRAQIKPPIVIVAHSFGGFVARLLLDRRADDIAGMILVDASHEDQFDRLASPGGKEMLPTGRQFVLSRPEVPANLAEPVRRQIEAFGLMRKIYSATHGEIGSFAMSARQVRASRDARNEPLDVPLVVIRRGLALYGNDAAGQERNESWARLQTDLAGISRRSRVIVAHESGHHIHADEPDVVAAAIADIIEEIRNDP